MLGEYHLGDCMDYLPDYPDNHFDLAIVDPPYGIGDRLMNGGGKLKNRPTQKLYREGNKWDIKPTEKYFQQLFRVSKNQIIHGGNYFNLPPTRCFVFWDKIQYMHTLSQAEFIWTSFDKPSKVFRKLSTDLNRFHPTQKPITLYKWLLKNYAKEGDLILDTHVGSASSLIACEDMGFKYVGYEKDPDYYRDSTKRLKQHIAQLKIF